MVYVNEKKSEPKMELRVIRLCVAVLDLVFILPLTPEFTSAIFTRSTELMPNPAHNSASLFPATRLVAKYSSVDTIKRLLKVNKNPSYLFFSFPTLLALCLFSRCSTFYLKEVHVNWNKKVYSL